MLKVRVLSSGDVCWRSSARAAGPSLDRDRALAARRAVGGIGAIDAGVTGALVLYGADASVSAGAEIISHGLALIVPILAGSIAFALLPGEINRTRHRREAPSAVATAG
jgi:hypothetical protein